MRLEEITFELSKLRSITDNILFEKLEDEHLDSLSSGILFYLDGEDMERIYPDYDINNEFLKKLRKLKFLKYFYSISRFNAELITTLSLMDWETILVLMGLRKSYTSIMDKTGLPPLRKLLLKSASKEYKERLSVAAKALSKHANRSEYWGEIKGKTEKKNREAIRIVSKIIDERLWWNKYRHSRDEIVFEIRVASGHGCRWNGEGTKFIGFVEPIDERSESNFPSEY